VLRLPEVNGMGSVVLEIVVITCVLRLLPLEKSTIVYRFSVSCRYHDRAVMCVSRICTLLLLLFTAIGLSPGGSSPALEQTKIKIHKTTNNNKTTTKHKKHKTTK
jgi:hypothetical protein